MQEREYIGFWRRFVAYMVDFIVVVVMVIGIQFSLLLLGIFDRNNPQDITSLEGMVNITFMLIFIAYFTFLESSSKQATLGKMMMKIKVVNANNERISILSALGRNLGRILSGIIMGIGYIMIAFTKNKQALHDKLAKTYVVGK